MTDQAEQRSDAWYQARKGRLTGSLAGAALGVSPNMKRADLMRMMVRDAVGAPRETNEFVENTIMTHGRFHESGSLFDYEIETGNKVQECGFFPFEDWSGASPDGLIDDDGLLEAKVPWGKRKDENPEFKSLEDQPHYYAQCQMELLATGRTWGHFWQSNSHGHKLEKFEVDQAWRDENLPKLRQFYSEYLWEVENNSEEHLLSKRIEIDTPDISKSLKEWDEVCEALDNLEDRKKDLLAELVEKAGNKNALLGGSRKLTRTDRAGSISYAKIVKQKLPELDLEPFRGKGSSFWQLR